MNAPLLQFRHPPPLAPPGASPLLAAILLAIALCEAAPQLAAWWDWPPHREARWHLPPEEATLAAEAMDRRRGELQAPK